MASYISNPAGPLARQFNPVVKPITEKRSQKMSKWRNNSLKQSQKGLKHSSIKRKSQKLSAEEKRIRAEVIKRDGVYCFITKRKGLEKAGEHFHHIIPKKRGGRGVLKPLINSAPLRTLIDNKSHTSVHRNIITPYDFYIWAVEDGYLERIILMEILINEWSRYVPIEMGSMIDQIRERNKKRWKKVIGKEIEVRDPNIIAGHYNEIVRLEVT